MAANVTSIATVDVAKNEIGLSDKQAEEALHDSGVTLTTEVVKQVRGRQKFGKLLAHNIPGHILTESLEATEQARAIKEVLVRKITAPDVNVELLPALVKAWDGTDARHNDRHITELKCAEITGVSGADKKKQASAPSIHLQFGESEQKLKSIEIGDASAGE